MGCDIWGEWGQVGEITSKKSAAVRGTPPTPHTSPPSKDMYPMGIEGSREAARIAEAEGEGRLHKKKIRRYIGSVGCDIWGKWGQVGEIRNNRIEF